MNQNASDVSITDNKTGRTYPTNRFIFLMILVFTGIYHIRNEKSITNLINTVQWILLKLLSLGAALAHLATI